MPRHPPMTLKETLTPRVTCMPGLSNQDVMQESAVAASDEKKKKKKEQRLRRYVCKEGVISTM